MTMRQMSAFMQLAGERKKIETRTLASATRMAFGAEADAFKKFMTEEENP